jgi:hypothetical protein
VTSRARAGVALNHKKEKCGRAYSRLRKRITAATASQYSKDAATSPDPGTMRVRR